MAKRESIYNGVLLVNKPQDFTSHDVVAKLRGILHERRIGHGGTLDPMATGVLPVFVGGATKAADYAAAQDKEYLAGFALGAATDTQDVTGTVTARSDVRADEAAVRDALAGFLGAQQQIPPMYSAVKIGGQKLYDLARKGKTVERPARDITIREIALTTFDETAQRGAFRVTCSKGTYVRTICYDLGQRLGCGGCMSALRRTRAGVFGIGRAFTMEQILAGEAEILPVDSLFADRPAVTLTEAEERLCRNGNTFWKRELADGDWRVYGPKGDFLMLGRCDGGRVSTIKSFFEVNDR